MSQDTNPSTQETARKADPREVLDPIKRTKILALLAMGCSRRMAAKQVGCAASTITRTAERDEQFHNQLAEAEAQADIRALRIISHAAQQEKYWRVAAWLLERRNPEEYGRRAPNTFTGVQVMKLLERAFAEVAAELPKEKLENVAAAFDDLLADVAVAANLPPPEKLEWSAEEANSQAIEPTAASIPRMENVRVTESVCPEPAHSHSASVKAPASNGRPHAEPAVTPPRRTSCLEQFVVRKPKPELQTVGS